MSVSFTFETKSWDMEKNLKVLERAFKKTENFERLEEFVHFWNLITNETCEKGCKGCFFIREQQRHVDLAEQRRAEAEAEAELDRLDFEFQQRVLTPFELMWHREIVMAETEFDDIL